MLRKLIARANTTPFVLRSTSHLHTTALAAQSPPPPPPPSSQANADIENLSAPTMNDNDERFVGMTGAEILYDLLKAHDVEQVFGYPGGAIVSVFCSFCHNIDDIKYFKNIQKYIALYTYLFYFPPHPPYSLSRTLSVSFSLSFFSPLLLTRPCIISFSFFSSASCL